ncbi:ABC transporter permease [Xanthocytophaga agilis]|uniref:ABC transporter permease n=1 Tax=Xanthocytophaga agilis TaxID=3048010 RepID=A0AAE3QXZ9_9BACT|nr:ABC transporter permease [Xanthocytophaga agilis]MDJ1499550.1 ABC transporter permease [Xanthocytophaga agilis]
MLHSYFTIAFRSLWKNKAFSLINISGLSLGIATFLLILEYISFEQSFNAFHTKLPRLYRALYEASSTGKTETWDFLPPGLAPISKDRISDIQSYCRIANNGMGTGIVTYSANDKNTSPKLFREEDVLYADGTYFELFTFPIVQGISNSLNQPNTVAISESYSLKYFGKESAIGKILTLNNQFGKHNYTVSIVFKDIPANSDLQSNIVLSLQTLVNPANLNGNDWAKPDGLSSQCMSIFYLLQEDADYKKVEQKINTLNKQLRPTDQEILRLQPAENIHLAQSLNDYYITTGNLGFIYLLGGIAILILFIAWFNYINLSTAGSLKRAKEVGVRKVMGASRSQLIQQFLGESILLNISGFLLALLLVVIVQDVFNTVIGKPLSLHTIQEGWLWILGITLLVTGSLFSGAYTAFVLSSFQPLQTLKGIFSKSGKGLFIRKSLVVFQFSISIGLIASTIILFGQLQYMQNTQLGMNLEQLLAFKVEDVERDGTFKQTTTVFLNQLAQLPYVKSYSNPGCMPGNWYNYNANGITRLNPRPLDEKKSYSIAIVDEHFIETFGIQLVKGENFTAEQCEKKWDDVDKIIVNEKAALELGFLSATEAVGKKIKWGENKQYEIIGLIKDYHHKSLQAPIDPVIFYPRHNGKYFVVRLTTPQIQSKVAELEKIYKDNFSGNPFEYFFVDENYNKQYQTEQQYTQLFTLASFLAIFIACLGLFGLATFTSEQRTKEIGIRKVLGASIQQILALLSKDFVRLLLIAFVITTPIIWYVANDWLQNFAYRIQVSWWIFALAGIIAFSIAILTISFQSIKAALQNPVKALRSE